MIDAASSPLPRDKPQQNTQSDVGAEPLLGGFSFSMAMNVLESKAAQSIQTFGAEPQSASLTAQTSPSVTTEAGRKAAPAPPDAENPTSSHLAKPTETAAAAQKPVPEMTQATQPFSSQALSAPVVNLAPAVAAASIIAQLPVAQTVKAGAVNIREAALMKTADIKAPRATQPPTPATAAPDFARLLARRLDAGATSFEVRLDPPELGRVEAHLKVGDDGESVLALKFENQSALDLFAKDEAGLKAALFASGFDLGGDRLAFTLAEKDHAIEAPSHDSAALIDSVPEPIFLAPFSTGAVDLRV